MKKIKIVFLASIIAVMLSGCTMPGWWNSAMTNTNGIDTGHFKEVVVIYSDKSSKTYSDVSVYPYNNGGNDSTGEKIEIRQRGKVIVLPNDAQVELRKN
ncbi:hypothetical protein [Lactobacillus crispatus]|jgi:putative lipoprotein|uniref:hypothetical protein n=2 Tax=Lactobacillus crispatus TaxID=47770 RepID=UPI000398983C|nr:hypothetical protein [Lactobacillus crispatus]MBG0736900.1 hypothetical protein [Lactobacillus crispatus]MCT7687719.1 hypothetical protein [Lactobacillus crispatus]MCZ3786343.1 hypothetical protein [Lactobacillus crispatus]MCZ3793968.1 hypothetical protein [Lactobacillus crispatus]MCZ9645549.1 hypothetical protein [Lactobacillus crispatus]